MKNETSRKPDKKYSLKTTKFRKYVPRNIYKDIGEKS
jgi:hypothetical protein